MADLKSPTLIWIKGILFLCIGLVASVLIVLRAPSLSLVALLLIAIWAFCRCYYFAFYVIQNYVDSSYRFAGLFDFVRYAIGSKRNEPSKNDEQQPS